MVAFHNSQWNMNNMYTFLNADHYPYIAFVKEGEQTLKFGVNPLYADALVRLYEKGSDDFNYLNTALVENSHAVLTQDVLNKLNDQDNQLYLAQLIDNILDKMEKTWFNLVTSNDRLYKLDDVIFEYIDDSLKAIDNV